MKSYAISMGIRTLCVLGLVVAAAPLVGVAVRARARWCCPTSRCCSPTPAASARPRPRRPSSRPPRTCRSCAPRATTPPEAPPRSTDARDRARGPALQRQGLHGGRRVGAGVEQPPPAHPRAAQDVGGLRRAPRAPGRLPHRPGVPPRGRPGRRRPGRPRARDPGAARPPLARRARGGRRLRRRLRPARAVAAGPAGAAGRAQRRRAGELRLRPGRRWPRRCPADGRSTGAGLRGPGGAVDPGPADRAATTRRHGPACATAPRATATATRSPCRSTSPPGGPATSGVAARARLGARRAPTPPARRRCPTRPRGTVDVVARLRTRRVPRHPRPRPRARPTASTCPRCWPGAGRAARRRTASWPPRTAPRPRGWPPWTARTPTPAPHLAYGVQWYLFALTGLVLWGVLARRAGARSERLARGGRRRRTRGGDLGYDPGR